MRSARSGLVGTVRVDPGLAVITYVFSKVSFVNGVLNDCLVSMLVGKQAMITYGLTSMLRSFVSIG